MWHNRLVEISSIKFKWKFSNVSDPDLYVSVLFRPAGFGSVIHETDTRIIIKINVSETPEDNLFSFYYILFLFMYMSVYMFDST